MTSVFNILYAKNGAEMGIIQFQTGTRYQSRAETAQVAQEAIQISQPNGLPKSSPFQKLSARERSNFVKCTPPTAATTTKSAVSIAISNIGYTLLLCKVKLYIVHHQCTCISLQVWSVYCNIFLLSFETVYIHFALQIQSTVVASNSFHHKVPNSLFHHLPDCHSSNSNNQQWEY